MRQRSPRQVKQIGNVTLIKTTTVHGLRQMRCNRCGNLCAPSRNAAGQEIMKCQSCNAEYGSRPM